MMARASFTASANPNFFSFAQFLTSTHNESANDIHCYGFFQSIQRKMSGSEDFHGNKKSLTFTSSYRETAGNCKGYGWVIFLPA